MRRRHDAFITVVCNKVAAVLSDVREAERCEHIGRNEQANMLVKSAATQLRHVCKALYKELDRRQISDEFMALKAGK